MIGVILVLSNATVDMSLVLFRVEILVSWFVWTLDTVHITKFCILSIRKVTKAPTDMSTVAVYTELFSPRSVQVVLLLLRSLKVISCLTETP